MFELSPLVRPDRAHVRKVLNDSGHHPALLPDITLADHFKIEPRRRGFRIRRDTCCALISSTQIRLGAEGFIPILCVLSPTHAALNVAMNGHLR